MTSSSPVAAVILERDSADLRCLAALLDAHRQWEIETKSRASIKALREWLWFYWQVPRRPQPLVRSKYPAPFPWSEEARLAIIADPNCALVMEHCEPVHLVIRDLLDHPLVDLNQLRELLHTRLACCVITKAEDAAINAAGFGTRMVPGAEHDRWARYRAAGIDPERFRPFTDPAFNQGSGLPLSACGLVRQPDSPSR
ncbi:hypothetical protein [Micromonospora sp. NBC_01813]|uniref:hypothetical protein n=1 Tax=Micromonospora sp. NBC_01813 TaxID=2975988 RepID=UPI002DDB60D7|nr:hypothetical protein [Micromonospora sp. NBC_01813]WSA08339.1 hypothetical protein OG958_29800 [Micromonospora sp. NBC_01813]